MRPRELSENEEPRRDRPVDWALEGQHSGEILAFRRLAASRRGFSLFVLQYNDPSYRDKVIPYLNLHAESPAVFRPEPQSGYVDFEKRLLELAAGHDLIHVVGLSEWLTGEARNEKFRGLNYHREYVAEKAPVAVALWMTENDIRDLAMQAPDMWAWRTAVIDFAVSARKPVDLELSRLDLGAANLPERRQRMKEIEDYLAGHPGESISGANLLRELALIYESTGRIDDAMRALTEAATIYRGRHFTREHAITLGDIRSRAVTLGDIARIFVSRGKTDEALKLQKERLEVFEQLGDTRLRAMTLSDMAWIYVSRGDVDLALKVHKEVLEVCEKLGDLDGKAKTLWSIGWIEARNKDFEAALQDFTASYDILLKIGRREGVCHVGLDLGRLLLQMNETEKGAAILRRSEEGFQKLGRDDMAQAARDLLAQSGRSPRTGKK